MSGLDNPILLLEGENFGGNLGQILNIIETNEPMPGYGNQPIYFGSNVVGTYSVYALNMPQNYSGNNSQLLKAYVVVINVTSVPSGSTGINVSSVFSMISRIHKTPPKMHRCTYLASVKISCLSI